MRILLFLLLGILVISLQTTVFQTLPEWIGAPDLILLLVVFFALQFKPGQGALLVVILGVGVEAFSGYFLGLYVMAYLLVFFITKGLSARFALNVLNHQPALVVLAFLFVNAFVYLVSLMLAEESPAPWGWGAILQRALIVTILTIPVGRGLSAAMSWCEKRRKHSSLFTQKRGNYYKARV